MRTVLITAYDVNPFKGSESATGWNFIYQASKYNKVIAITRENNRHNIEKFISLNKIDSRNIKFYYFDLPYWARFWKRKSRGVFLYFYLWQLSLPFFIRKKRIHFDIAHNLNFHTDTVPTFLWSLNKPTIWGPINHHEKIPSQYITSIQLLLKEYLKWSYKKLLWNLDIFNYLARYRTSIILAGNKSVIKRLKLPSEKTILFPQVGAEDKGFSLSLKKEQKTFHILFVGRFVPLKAPDLVIEAFAHFYKRTQASNIKLTMAGTGPEEKKLRKLTQKYGIEKQVEFTGWIKKEKLSELYKKAHVFFFPSYEGAGMVIPEALSFATPVLCFDNYGPGELVDNSCGIKIPYTKYSQSISDFSEALYFLYKRRDILIEKAINARKKFEEEFDWNKKGKKLNEIYNIIQK